MPKPGELWVAEVDYTDGTASKRRPVLILWVDGLDSIVAAVTSKSSSELTEVRLSDWQSSGLRRESTVRLMRLDVFANSRLVRPIGEVSRRDADMLNQTWAEHMSLDL